jgi:hypothetical protein
MEKDGTGVSYLPLRGRVMDALRPAHYALPVPRWHFHDAWVSQRGLNNRLMGPLCLLGVMAGSILA